MIWPPRKRFFFFFSNKEPGNTEIWTNFYPMKVFVSKEIWYQKYRKITKLTFLYFSLSPRVA